MTSTLTNTNRPNQAGTVARPPARHAAALLDDTYERLRDGDISSMSDFVARLNAIRGRLAVPEWRGVIDEIVSAHPLRDILHEEPFARRAFQKPRGYAGDAPTLDLIYGESPFPPEGLSEIGARLFRWARVQPACLSVKERRLILASLIDQVASEYDNPRILSLACGHLREAQSSEAVLNGRIAEIVAVDQDAESLALVAREQSAHNVTTCRASVRRFLAAPAAHGLFDFAYSAGLYDYLEDRVASAVTRALFASLRPGGLLLIANFRPDLRDIGYMEAVMDWQLIYRDEAAITACAETIPDAEIEDRAVFCDSVENVVYLTVRKRR
jgi:extracellular factor (EF) 3-hydroxypalmitic acid methyl ester biosynthesis protein